MSAALNPTFTGDDVAETDVQVATYTSPPHFKRASKVNIEGAVDKRASRTDGGADDSADDDDDDGDGGGGGGGTTANNGSASTTAKYECRVYTADTRNAGTDAKVFITMSVERECIYVCVCVCVCVCVRVFVMCVCVAFAGHTAPSCGRDANTKFTLSNCNCNRNCNHNIAGLGVIAGRQTR
jgi:hypothetical protein